VVQSGSAFASEPLRDFDYDLVAGSDDGPALTPSEIYAIDLDTDIDRPGDRWQERGRQRANQQPHTYEQDDTPEASSDFPPL
jgi:hypothetical protein